jgi:DMSO reductase anchor subunit
MSDTGGAAGVYDVREQRKLEARKMLENGGESHLSAARAASLFLSVSILLCLFAFHQLTANGFNLWKMSNLVRSKVTDLLS